MEQKKLLQQFKPPCNQCPYKLGLVQTVINPCPQCKVNGYKTYEQFSVPVLYKILWNIGTAYRMARCFNDIFYP